MPVVGQLKVELTAETVKFSRPVQDASRDLEALGKRAQEAGSNLEKLGNRAAQIGRTLSLSVTAPLAAIGGTAIKMAMDAVESENLFEVSMGRMADAARKWSEELRQQLGLNAYEVRKQVGTFNVMFTSMGLGEQAAYGMAKGLTQLAYDMSSFYNLKPEEAFLKLQAAIAGEIEPLRRLGVNINEATVQAYALKTGLIEQGQQLSETGKAVARYGAIMEQMGKVHGDLSRTIESPANQLRILQSEAKQVAIDFGMALLPAFQDALAATRPLVDKLKELVAWFAALSPSAQQTIVKIAALAAAAGPAALALSGIEKVAAILLGGLAGLATGAGKIAFALGAWQGGAATAGEALKYLFGAFTPFLVGGTVAVGLGAIVSLFLQLKEHARLAKVEIASITDVVEAQRVYQYWVDKEKELLELQKRRGHVIGGATVPAEFITKGLEEARARVAEAKAALDKLKAGAEAKVTFEQPDWLKNLEAALSGTGLTTTGKDVRTAADVLEDMNAALAQAAEKEKLLGDAFDLNAEKANIFSRAIDELIKLGVKASDPLLVNIRDRWKALGATELEATLHEWRQDLKRVYVAQEQTVREVMAADTKQVQEWKANAAATMHEWEQDLKRVYVSQEQTVRDVMAADTKRLEEWRAQVEATLHEWEQDLKRVYVSQEQAVRNVMAADAKQLEEWEANRETAIHEWEQDLKRVYVSQEQAVRNVMAADAKQLEEWKAQVAATLHEWEQGLKRVYVSQEQAVRDMMAADTKALEEWKAQREAAIHEWEQDLKRVYVSQEQAVRNVMAADTKQLEEWKEQATATLELWERAARGLATYAHQGQALREMMAEDASQYAKWREQMEMRITMARVSIGRPLTARLDVEAQIAAAIGEPGGRLEAEAAAVRAAIDTTVESMLALGKSSEEAWTEVQPLVQRLAALNQQIKAISHTTQLTYTLLASFADGLAEAGNAWTDFLSVVVSSIKLATDDAGNIIGVDWKQTLVNIADYGLRRLGQALGTLFGGAERLRQQYPGGAYGEVNYPDLAQMRENYENWNQNFQALQQAQQAQAGMTVGGGLLGGIIGFLVGGPFGALVGAGLGAGAGHAAGQATYGKQIEELQEKLKTTFQSIAEALGSAIGNIADALANAFSAETYEDFVAGFGQNLEQVIKQALIKGFLAGEVMRPLLQGLSDLITQAVMAGGLDVWVPAVTVGGAVAQQIGAGQTYGQAIQSLASQIVETAQPFFETLQQLDLGFGELSGTVSEVTEALRNVPTGFKIAAARWDVALPAYQEGGVVGRTGVAVLHAGETVVPAGELGGIHVHLEGATIYGMDDFERKVEAAVSKAARRAGLGYRGLARAGAY